MFLVVGINVLDKELDREIELRGLFEVLDVVVFEGGIVLDYVIVWDNMFIFVWYIIYGILKGFIFLLFVIKNLRKSYINYIVLVEVILER